MDFSFERGWTILVMDFADRDEEIPKKLTN